MTNTPDSTDITSADAAQQRLVTISQLRETPTVTVGVAAAALGITRSAAYAAAGRGQIPTIRLGRRLVVPTPLLLRMLGAEQTAVSDAPHDLPA